MYKDYISNIIETDFMEEILNILDKEKGNVSRAKIAQMLGMEEKEVADKIEKMEKEYKLEELF